MTTLDSSQWMYSSASEFYSHSIDQSLRFEDGDNPYLSKTFSSSGGTIFTFSCWVKLGNLSINRCLLQGYSNSSNFAQILLYSGDYIGMYSATSGTARLFAYTQALQRDPSAWYNIVVKFNGTSGSEEFKIYVNGENQDLTTSTSLSAHQSNIGNSNSHYIGNNFNQSLDMDGYMAEVNFIDGTALDADSFGETKAGIWIPKDTSGLTFGTNGFRLKFQDSSALGDDTSGNGNDFTASGLAATDVVLDSPTNNFANFNVVSGPNFYGTAGTYSQGNLHMRANNSVSSFFGADSTIGVSSGKWYWEIRPGSNGSSFYPGIGIRSPSGGGSIIHYRTQTQAYINGNPSGQTLSTYTGGDIIGVALDLDSSTNTLQFYKNNVANGSTFSLTSGHEWLSITGNRYHSSTSANFGADSSFFGQETAQGNADANGKGDFYYSPPSGFLALCSANLPDPAIDPAQDEEPADYFNTVLYTGDGVNGRSITSVGFDVDFLWSKKRNAFASHNLHDVIRGAGERLKSDSTDAESSTGSHPSFITNGFTVPSSTAYNASSSTYVAWNWLAGGSAVSNTNGSITSSVSANTKAGFSVLTFTGNGSGSATVGTGLDRLDMVIVKSRDTSRNWWVAHKDMSGNLQLDSTTALITSAGSGGKLKDIPSLSDGALIEFVSGSSNVNNVNASGEDYVAYCFKEIDGYSKVGSYTGNGSSDGRFIYTGFRPAWILIKNIIDAEFWTLIDNKRLGYNETNSILSPNSNTTEYSAGGGGVDILSNGFKLRGTSNNFNGSGDSHIYLSFSEQPFKYSNAR